MFFSPDQETETHVIKIVEGNDKKAVRKLNDDEVLPVLPLRNMVLFPGVLLPVSIGRPKSLKLVKKAFEDESLIAVCCQKDSDVQEPEGKDIYTLGTAARVIRTFDMPDGSTTVILEGSERILIDKIIDTQPFLMASVKTHAEIFPKRDDKAFLATLGNVKDIAEKILQSSNLPKEASLALHNIDNPPTLVNYICVNFSFDNKDKQALLAQDKLEERAFMLLELLNKQLQMIQIKQSIQEKAMEDINRQQREYYLQQQMQTIQKELGNTSAQTIEALKDRAKTKKWSDSVQQTFEKELKKLEMTSPHSPEYATQQNYLETILSLPWNEFTEDNFNIKNAKKVLDNDHYGMEKVKERILEYLSVLKLKN